MGLLIKGLLGALVVVLIGVLAKTKNYAIAGLVPLFPTFALIAHYIVASERGIEALRATIVFGMWSILPYFIYLLSTVVFHRDHAPAVGAGRRGGMLGAVRLAVNPRLEPFPLAQRAAAVDSE
ncbi:inner membrane protein [Klebsiella pneumoniae]|uniref:Inner membrane protein n=1 Tax=Klebsiella pneumoniae TaxID=573 RepID=A0A3S5DGY5_KLEPN|nr:inner membrane protein [Klebsiella pneumoniae]